MVSDFGNFFFFDRIYRLQRKKVSKRRVKNRQRKQRRNLPVLGPTPVGRGSRCHSNRNIRSPVAVNGAGFRKVKCFSKKTTMKKMKANFNPRGKKVGFTSQYICIFHTFALSLYIQLMFPKQMPPWKLNHHGNQKLLPLVFPWQQNRKEVSLSHRGCLKRRERGREMGKGLRREGRRNEPFLLATWRCLSRKRTWRRNFHQ